MSHSSPDLRARVLAAASSHAAPTRAVQRRYTAIAFAFGIAVVVALAGMHGARGLLARPWAYDAVLLGGFVLVAVRVFAPLLAYRDSPLGPHRAPFLARARLAPLWLAVVTLLANTAAPATWGPPVGAMAPHATCFGLALGAGFLVALCAFYTLRGSDPVAPRALGTALGLAAGTVAGLAMSVACSLADPVHVLIGHVLPMVLLGALAGALGARVLRVPAVEAGG